MVGASYMSICIEEDDSFIQKDGKSKMIIVAVKKSDGKVVRFPYSAKLSLSSLIKEVNEKIGVASVSTERFVPLPDIEVKASMFDIKNIIGESEGQIKKECLVKCVKLLPRDKDAPIDMEVGQNYRVLAIPTGKVPYYEIIDDTDYHKADIPRRVAAYPEEIVFFQKRKPPIEKTVGRFEDIFNCELCKKSIVGYRMDDNKYHAMCNECNHETISDTVRQPVAQIA
jgi:hypothetical protein